MLKFQYVSDLHSLDVHQSFLNLDIYESNLKKESNNNGNNDSSNNNILIEERFNILKNT